MGNEVKMIEWFNDHWYKIIEKTTGFIASVTTKLGIENKDQIARWRGDIGNREADMRMNEAGNRGKRIHWAWYVYVLGGPVIYNPWQNPNYTEKEIEEFKKANALHAVIQNQDEMVQVWKLQRFFDKMGAKVLHAEQIVYSVEHDEAGTLDNAFLIEKGTYDVSGSKKLIIPETGIYIADLKTGKVIPDNIWNQMAPYAQCYDRMGFGKVAGALALHTTSQNKGPISGFGVKIRMAEELEHDYEIYKHLAAVWDERNQGKKPLVFEFPTLIQRGK